MGDISAAIDAAATMCPDCRGTGADPLSDNVNWLPCWRCRGTGRLPEESPDGR